MTDVLQKTEEFSDEVAANVAVLEHESNRSLKAEHISEAHRRYLEITANQRIAGQPNPVIVQPPATF